MHVAQKVMSACCMVVDLGWREGAGKVKITGYKRVSNEQVHQCKQLG